MADTQDTTGSTTPESKTKPKTVAADMAQRSTFPTVTEAEQFLTASGERFTDWGKQVFVLPPNGLIENEDGSAGLNPELFGAEGMETMIALLREKGKGGQVKCIVAAPVPTLEALLGVEVIPESAGTTFARAIIHKELNHRMVRALREAADPTTVASEIPTTLAGYIESGRGDGGLMGAFNELYKQINATMSSAVNAWAKRRLTKPELKKAMESKGYALDNYPELEEAGKAGSLFEKAIALGRNAAKRKGLDPAIFDRWEETRATKVYEPGEDDEEELDLDLDALTDSMLAEPEADKAEGDTSEDQTGEGTGEGSDDSTDTTPQG